MCHREPVNPTAAPSGFVYCSECIQEAVARDGVCPLSNIRTTPEELCAIYETSRPPGGGGAQLT